MEIKPLHIVIGLGVVGVGYLLLKPKAAAAASATATPAKPLTPATTTTTPVAVPPPAFDSTKVLNVVLDPGGKTVNLAPGTSMTFSNAMTGQIWSDPGVVSSNETIVSPQPGSFSNFVTVKPGAAVVTGYYTDNSGAMQKATVTIVVVDPNAPPAQ
jgi:hypothetical protein